jgi:hypothetical protein
MRTSDIFGKLDARSTLVNLIVVFACLPLVMGIRCGDEPEDGVGPDQGAATFTQVDRVGIPALNTVFNHPSSSDKMAYNAAAPGNDVDSYTSAFLSVLTALANDDTTATAAALLPDILSVNLGTQASNFANFDGRKPADDAIDIVLRLVVGSNLSELHSDNVDANDVPFPPTFPFLAPPN